MPAVSSRKSLLIAAPILLTMSIAACAAPPEDRDHGDYGDTNYAIGAGPCALSREQILAAAGDARREVVERAFTWYDAQVPYSQSRTYEGYRTDCSGFVSMAWGLGQSCTTADFYDGGGESFALSGYEELAAGDALVHRSGGSGHIVLFLGWNDDSQSSACVIEEANTSADMQFGTRSTSSLMSGGYKAIRAEKLRDATSADPASSSAGDGYPAQPGADGMGDDGTGDPYADPNSGSDPYGDPYADDPYSDPAPDPNPGGVECYSDDDCPYPMACVWGQCG